MNIVLEFCEVWTEFAICFRFARCPRVSVRCKLTIRNSLETNALHTWELAVTLESTKDFTSCVISLCTTTKGQIFPILLLVSILWSVKYIYNGIGQCPNIIDPNERFLKVIHPSFCCINAFLLIWVHSSCHLIYLARAHKVIMNISVIFHLQQLLESLQ